MKPHALIIGAGIAGLSTARALAARNFRLTLIDASFAGAASPASGGVLAALHPWRVAAPVDALIADSRAKYAVLFRDFDDNAATPPFAKSSGALYLDVEDLAAAQAWCEQNREQNARAGRLLRAADLARLNLPATVERAFLLPDTWRVNAAQLLEHLAALPSVRRAVTFVRGHAVTEIDFDGVRLDDGRRLTANYTVVCAGAWTARLLPEIPVRPVRGQMLELSGLTRHAPYMLLSQDRYLLPQGDGRCLVGSTVEEVGFDAAPTADAGEQLLAFAQRYASYLGAASEPMVSRHYAGLRPAAPQHPFIGEVPRLPGVFVNSGLFRNGIAAAPAAADLIAALICGETPRLNPQLFRVP